MYKSKEINKKNFEVVFSKREILTDGQGLNEFENDFVVDYYHRLNMYLQYVKMYKVNDLGYLILDYKFVMIHYLIQDVDEKDLNEKFRYKRKKNFFVSNYRLEIFELIFEYFCIFQYLVEEEISTKNQYKFIN